VISTNTSEFFISHRLHLGLAAKNAGWQVHVLAPKSARTEEIIKLGFNFVEIPMSRKGMNPLAEAKVFYAYYNALKKINPNIYHGFTIKPVIYGCLAARLAKIPKIIASITGLGYTFLRADLFGKARVLIIGFLYRMAFQFGNVRVIFQNHDDMKMFVNNSWVDAERAQVIPGTGVDIQSFQRSPEPPGEVKILFPARFLKDKGIEELISAGELLHKKNIKFQIVLCGKIDPGNPASLDQQDMTELLLRPYVKSIGYSNAMSTVMANCHIVCLPSYREGIPLSLLEAAASGRPIVTTDTPGCRDVVKHNHNGLLVPPYDAHSLAAALEILIESPSRRESMGQKSRRMAEEDFAKEGVLSQFLEIYTQG
jgi:glycosyltransferase involved in cell wall biosynthesis